MYFRNVKISSFPFHLEQNVDRSSDLLILQRSQQH